MPEGEKTTKSSTSNQIANQIESNNEAPVPENNEVNKNGKKVVIISDEQLPQLPPCNTPKNHHSTVEKSS